MTVNVSPTQVLAVLGVLVVVVMMWRRVLDGPAGQLRPPHTASQVVSLAGHVVVTAGVIVGASGW